MADEIVDGVRMALRRWRRMFSLAAMTAIACAALALVLSDVLVQLTAFTDGQALRSRQAVIFDPFYATAGVSAVDDDVVTALVGDIQAAHGYTAIVQNVQVDNPNFAEGTRTIIVVGDALDEVFDRLKLCRPAPCGMRGHDLADRQFRPVAYAGTKIPIDATLESSAAFFDPNLGAVPLDDRVVIRLPAESLLRVNDIEREEAVTRAVLFGMPAERIDDYVAGASRGGLFLVPHNIAVSQPQRLAGIMVVSAMYILGLGAFLTLVLAAYASSARTTIREHRRSFVIRRMHGAGTWHVVARLGGFVGVVVLIPPLVPLLLLLSLGDPMAESAILVMLAVAVTYLALLAWLSLNLIAQELRGR